MKKVFLSLIMLFIVAGCESPNVIVAVDNLTIKVEDNISINADVLFNIKISKQDKEKYEYGFILDKNNDQINLDEFKLNGDLSYVIAKPEKDLSFSYVFDELSPLDYILPITIRGYVKNSEKQVFYTDDVFSFIIYQEALKSDSDYAKDIVNAVKDNILIAEDLSLTLNIDVENKGFNVVADFKEFDENYVYGLFYKHNASTLEQEDLTFSSEGYNIIYSKELDNNSLKEIFSEILEADYLTDITFRSFIYNELDKTFIFNDETVTTSLYDLALLDGSEFSLNVVDVVSGVITLKELFINTDVKKKYEVDSHSEGIEVKMFYDYKIVRLTITAKNGYRFSPQIKNENITILRVDDNIVVSKFTMEVSLFTIVIEYDDYGWTPPM